MRRIAILALLVACRHEPEEPGCADVPFAATGEATYYTADGTGSCSFDASPGDLMVAAMNGADYDRAAWCGACLEVTGPHGAVVVRVVDQCPGCKHGDLDLSPQAFQQLAPLDVGRIPITWHEVACPVPGSIDYHFKEKSNEFWTGIQIRGHRYPVHTLEILGSNGVWKDIARLDYNYFVGNGLGAGPYTLRVTDTRGHRLQDTGIVLGADVTRAGQSQFPTCP